MTKLGYRWFIDRIIIRSAISLASSNRTDAKNIAEVVKASHR